MNTKTRQFSDRYAPLRVGDDSGLHIQVGAVGDGQPTFAANWFYDRKVRQRREVACLTRWESEEQFWERVLAIHAREIDVEPKFSLSELKRRRLNEAQIDAYRRAASDLGREEYGTSNIKWVPWQSHEQLLRLVGELSESGRDLVINSADALTHPKAADLAWKLVEIAHSQDAQFLLNVVPLRTLRDKVVEEGGWTWERLGRVISFDVLRMASTVSTIIRHSDRIQIDYNKIRTDPVVSMDVECDASLRIHLLKGEE